MESLLRKEMVGLDMTKVTLKMLRKKVRSQSLYFYIIARDRMTRIHTDFG